MADTYTFPTPPNPEVYRLAAEHLSRGDNVFSCYAIRRACWNFGVREIEADLYAAQYECVFGPEHGQPPIVRGLPFHPDQHPMAERSDKFDDRPHPFWNRGLTPERQNLRILALLLMADICENPTCP